MAEHPLLRVLIAESTRRGDTLAAMANQLGVTYEHVAQWRRKEYDIAKATRPVLEAAARYLAVPTAFVLCLAGIVGVEDFARAGHGSLQERTRAELARMQVDPYFAGFIPEALRTADLSVQRLGVFLYRELSGGCKADTRPFEWMRSLELAALGHVRAQVELAALMTEQDAGTRATAS
jgi:hypothetical protein